MCGIAGFIDRKKIYGLEELSAMAECLAHRGPDGHGKAVFDQLPATVALGHRRLSIIDLEETGSQPMYFDKWCIVFNGEIYNYREIRQDLEKMGRQFTTHSDTEVILQSFDQWGLDAVHRFIGMFAFALLHMEKKKVWFFRDRPGVKPFYYYASNDSFLFASELKSFHKHPSFKKEMDTAAIAQFLQVGYITAPNTIFRNTYKLEPGHYLEFDLPTFSFTKHRYWNVADHYNKPKLQIGESEAIEETEKLMRSAVEYRMVADVPVGVFLSGGYDSSTVTALLQTGRTEKIKTFSIGFEENGFDEAPYAKRVAHHLGTDHTEYYCTINDARELLPSIAEYWDEPFGDASAIPTMLVSKLARKEVTVALSADAGDELFGGYSKYTYIMNAVRKAGLVPKPIRKAAAGILKNIDPSSIPVLNKKYNFQARYYKGIALLGVSDVMEGLAAVAKIYSDNELSSLIKSEFEAVDYLGSVEKIKNPYADPLSQMLCTDYQTYMVDDVLTKVDRATMSVSLEGREPFLDHRLVEWAAQLPSDLKIKNGAKKSILKEICHKYVPREIMERPKMGFTVPIASWFDAEIASYVEKYLNDSYISRQNIFNAEVIKAIVNNYRQSRKENIFKLWNLVMFQLWYEKWMA